MNIFKNDISLNHNKHTSSVFGEQDQLKVLGYYQIGYTKHFVVECSICKQDPELFSFGLFTTSIGHLRINKYPCGCSSIPKWNVDQQYTRVKRSCDNMGYSLLTEFENLNYTNQNTPIKVSCSLHGAWSTTVTYITEGRGCRKCADDANSINRRKPDEIMIESFFASGSYHPETTFRRSERKTSQGARNYWWVDCPICGHSGEAISGDLKKGNQPCQCVKNQRQAYINLVSEGSLPIAIKFGIAKDYKSRVPRQNKHSIYEVTNLKAWEFPSKELCIQAELECKQLFDCGVVHRTDMPDGFSETTYIYNLDKISKVFEDYGGVSIH